MVNGQLSSEDVVIPNTNLVSKIVDYFKDPGNNFGRVHISAKRTFRDSEGNSYFYWGISFDGTQIQYTSDVEKPEVSSEDVAMVYRDKVVDLLGERAENLVLIVRKGEYGRASIAIEPKTPERIDRWVPLREVI